MKIRQYSASGYKPTELSFNIFVDKNHRTFYNMVHKRPDISNWNGAEFKLTTNVIFIWSMK